MALNIAVPLSGVAEYLGEHFNLISPLSLRSSSTSSSSSSHSSSGTPSPNNFDCRTTLKVLCSPIESESSGISSLDSEEIKKSSVSSSPATDDENNVNSDQGGRTPPLIITSELSAEKNSHLLSPKPKHATTNVSTTINKQATTTEDTSTESNVDIIDEVEKNNKKEIKEDGSAVDENAGEDDTDVKKEFEEIEKTQEKPNDNNNETKNYYSIEEQRKLIAKLQIEINGRNILDLGANLNYNQNTNNYNNNTIEWQQRKFFSYSHLPQNNLKMFLENRSQYHRLGANGHQQEYALVMCKCCDFIYPEHGYANTNCSTNNFKTTNNNMMMHGGNGNTITNTNGTKSALIASVIANVRLDEPKPPHQPPTGPISRPNPNVVSPSVPNSLFKQQQQAQQYFDTNTYNNNNNFTALNRINNNNNNNNNNMNTNNILENIAAALLNTNVAAIAASLQNNNNNNNNNNNGLNYNKNYNNNNTHHYFNNNNNNNNHHQQQHYGGGHFGSNNHYNSSHSYHHAYKQF